MRYPNSPIWDIWKTGRYVGDQIVVGAVTVEPDYWLTESLWTNISRLNVTGRTSKSPIRWWRKADDDQIEWIVPNVLYVDGSVSMDSDAGEATIAILNQKMHGNEEPQHTSNQLGRRGYYSPGYGGTRLRSERQTRIRPTYGVGTGEANARWGHEHNDWYGVLSEGALVRTYEGYWHKDIETIEELREAQAAGMVAVSGTWLVDTVDEASVSGELQLKCRDMAKLLLEQKMVPPFMPFWHYPLRYLRWKYEMRTRPGRPGDPVEFKRLRCTYRDSSGDRWYPSRVVPGKGAPIHGHYPVQAIDSSRDTYWLSVGNSHGSKPFAYDWIEFDTHSQQVNAIKMNTWGAGYQVFISVMENGVWQGTNTIPYDHTPLLAGLGSPNQPTVVDTGADIKYVHQSGAGGQSGSQYTAAMTVILPRTYKAQRIRITMHNHVKTPWGPWYYRCGIRDFYPAKVGFKAVSEEVKVPGNYTDYTDIVRDIVLWAGFWLLPENDGFGNHYEPAGRYPQVYGNLETTGAWSDEPLPADMFDKVAPMEAINAIKEIVGYTAGCDAEGAFYFTSPNWWQAGNIDETGRHVGFIPEIDELLLLMGWTSNRTDQHARSEVTIATEDPTAMLLSTKKFTYRPPTRDVLRGMVKPAWWVNGTFQSDSEQQRMAELISMHIWFQSRSGSCDAPHNPLLWIDDQVRIYEETTGQTFIHHVRGKKWRHDYRTHQSTMTLTTAWLGTSSDLWAIQRGTRIPRMWRKYIVPDDYESWERIQARIEGRYYPAKFTIAELQSRNAEVLAETGGALPKGLVLEV